jgi:glycerate dehydrogenase
MQLISAGADHIPYHKIPGHITIASNTGAYAKPIAEHVLAMSLTSAKRLREEHHNMKKGEFNQYNHPNMALYNSTVGILGFGGIGKTAARLFRAFGARIFAMNTSGKSSEPTDFVGTMDDLKMILKSSDIVVLSLPLNNHTRGLIGKEQLNWMKPDGILVNVARGEIINQKELYEHLKQYPSFKAGLESWWVEPVRHGRFELDYPFLELPNVLASPHNSAVVPGIMEHGVDEAAKNIQKYLHGEPFKGEVCRKYYF